MRGTKWRLSDGVKAHWPRPRMGTPTPWFCLAT
ncbi:UNVERIFIED_CONTAM: hypothetical protein GTU68_060461 [Idotea baltica]|nr:hypothetical protein [Idotea baltica]